MYTENWQQCYNYYGKESCITWCDKCPHKKENLLRCKEKRIADIARYEDYLHQKEMTEWNAS